MSLSDQHKEKKVLVALDLIYNNPGIKATKVARKTRVFYFYVLQQLKEVSCLSTRGNHNKKLDVLSLKTLKEYFFLCITS
jgi:hypothetical protein